MQQQRSTIALLMGPLAAAVIGAVCLAVGLTPKATATAAIAALCAVWWVTEALPLPVTSLVPFVALPLSGVLDHAAVAKSYGHTLILLLLGGFILSQAMEKSGAHRRLAILLIRAVGARSRRRVVLGFMLATGLLSMWISNTAVTLMMLPIALAALEHDDGDMAAPLLLGVAYASSIGGLGTPIGTPPNIVFMGVYRTVFGMEWSFFRWMQIGVPVVVIFLPITWWWLTRRLSGHQGIELPELGSFRPKERRVLLVFTLTAIAWVTRTEPGGGWAAWFNLEAAGDATVALLAVVLLFLISDGEGGRMLDWKTAERIPWGLLILFGGGIALAEAFETSGLSARLGDALAELARGPLVTTVLILCAGVTFLTELTSNTATAALLMPVLAAAAPAAGVAPELLMIPAVLSTSCAFMMPVATVPNAIVLATGKLSTGRMAKEGLALNLIGVIVIAGASLLLLT